jgi:hypothetical protein
MRRFELTISVWGPDDDYLPETFQDWIELAGFTVDGASPTVLERVVECKHPPAEDIIERRHNKRSPY